MAQKLSSGLTLSDFVCFFVQLQSTNTFFPSVSPQALHAALLLTVAQDSSARSSCTRVGLIHCGHCCCRAGCKLQLLASKPS